jgi:hypothetical protein
LHNFVYLGDPRAHSLPVVGEDPLAAARHLCLLAAGLWHGVTRSSASGGDNPVNCAFSQILINRDSFSDSG